MNSWRDSILTDFIPNISKLTIVADPDGLLTEEKLSLELRRKGFDIIEFNDPVEFRYAYESNYRSIWDKGNHTDLVVILRLHDSELSNLPYDLLKKGRRLGFDLGTIFPNLSYPVIESLDRQYLDAVFESQQEYAQDPMGDNATKDFILRHVFGIASELINDEVDLLRILLRCHYKRLDLSEILCSRLVQVFTQNHKFQDWPLKDIINDSKAFFLFLQERWPVYLETLGPGSEVQDVKREYGFEYSGPDLLPFDHQDIKVYIDNLFLDGMLSPVDLPIHIAIENNSWAQCGIVSKGEEKSSERARRLYEKIKKSLPEEECRYSGWMSFAQMWAEFNSLCNKSVTGLSEHELEGFAQDVNEHFLNWLKVRYASLINQPPMNPAMVHHIPRFLERFLEKSPEKKIALIVVDGLAMDQWVTMREVLLDQTSNLVMRESSIFAWIPTLTSVSRQAIFAGKLPVYFPSSIFTTAKEQTLWQQFWEGAGRSRLDIAYKKGLGLGNPAEELEDVIHPNTTRIIGLVVDTVDKIMHGMQLGSAGMHNQIEQWCQKGFLLALITYLLDLEYEIWLTSDHGNIECKGMGRPAEGVIAETRGERVRVYPTVELRRSVADAFAFSCEWGQIGLPDGYYPLIAKGRSAFVKENKTIVGHGGISLEEVIVPFVKIERRIV